MLHRCSLLRLTSQLAFIVLIAAINLAYAQSVESIRSFNETIIVNKDASIDVKEAITVFANQDKIIHGIVRFLPIRYTDSYGIAHYTNYQILKVMKDGLVTSYHTSNTAKQMGVYIGNKDIILSPGEYTYELQYRVPSAINFLKDGDELYWNITGNEWAFAIETAQVTIILPQGAAISYYAGYTGIHGAKGKDFEVEQVAANEIQFKTTKPLMPGEGFSVATAWQKGIVTPPTRLETFRTNAVRNIGQVSILLISFILFFYYGRAWYTHGRDPLKSTIFPLFEPPHNLSPAAVRYIKDMQFDMKVFTATIISLATKGYLTVKTNGVLTLSKQKVEDELLPNEEKVTAKALFKNHQSIDVVQDNRELIVQAKAKLKDALSKQFENKYFVTNRSYLWPGLLLSILAFAIAIFTADDSGLAFFGIAWLSIWTAACYTLFAAALVSIRQAISYVSFGNIVRACFTSLFAFPFLIGEVFGLFAFGNSVSMFIVPFLFFIVIINLIFSYLLKAPTVEGRKVMDQIEGFKMYLGTAERYRLEELNAPAKTPELFEKYLPYAIALDVENQWGEQFNEVLKKASTATQGYSPVWYSGSSFNTANLAVFPAFINSSIGNALASASVSSSASSGGGSSGGGGGGGGGGGW